MSNDPTLTAEVPSSRDSSSSSSSSSSYEDDAWTSDGSIQTDRCRLFWPKWCSPSLTALSISLSTLLVGILLVIFSKRTDNVQEDSLPIPIIYPLSPEEKIAYWQQLKVQVIPPGKVIMPNSFNWRALEWMTMEDPLLPLSGQSPMTQRFALASLYYNWYGDDWSMLPEGGWMRATLQSGTSVPHECSWSGIECSTSNGNGGDQQVVTTLRLDTNKQMSLFGTIPPELSRLTALERMDLSGHSLKGSLPAELSRLNSTLRFMYLQGNRLTGIDVLGNLTALEELDVSVNNLHDRLSSNVLAGLTRLRTFRVAENVHLHGDDIFKAILEWPDLRHVDISNTGIRGSLPDRIGDLKYLTSLKATSIPVDGTIPISIGKLTKLQALTMGMPTGGLGNGEEKGLIGTIPTQIGLMTSLRFLSLTSQLLNSTLPTELGMLSSLEVLDFRFTKNIKGTLPVELGRLSNTLAILRLGQTSLAGTVPPEWAALTHLQFLDISGTRVEGTMPESICQLASIREILVDCGGNLMCQCCVCAGL